MKEVRMKVAWQKLDDPELIAKINPDRAGIHPTTHFIYRAAKSRTQRPQDRHPPYRRPQDLPSALLPSAGPFTQEKFATLARLMQ
jgi:hypothetical protein